MYSALEIRRELNFPNIKHVAPLLTAFILSACTSNQYLIESETARNFSPAKENIFVANQEQVEQFSILDKSGIYNIVGASETDKELYLVNYGQHPICGMPFIASAIFLGIWPVSVTETHYFAYEIKHGKNSQRYIHEIPVKLRVSIWEWFAKPFSNSKEEILIEGLSSSKRRPLTEQDPI